MCYTHRKFKKTLNRGLLIKKVGRGITYNQKFD